MPSKKAITNSDKKIDDLYGFHKSAFLRSIDIIERDVDRLISQGLTDSVLIKSKIEIIITKSGYREALDGYLSAGYQDTLNESYNLYQNLYNKNFNFSPESLASFSIRKGQDLGTFSDLLTNYVNSVNKQLVNSSLSGISSALTTEAASGIASTLGLYSQTELETSVARLYRTANNLLASDNGIELFQYTGPTSGNIRPFCLEHVGQIKTRAAWNELNNGPRQPKPVMEFQGGYRCRHSLIGVPGELLGYFEGIETETRAAAEARQ